MKFHWLALPGLFLAGCIANNGLGSAGVSENNVWSLSRISEGMNEYEVIRIMGKPFEFETIVVGDDIYDVWFYITSPSLLGQTRMVKQNLTPLSFKNGVLIGWGYRYYDKVLAAQRKIEAPPSLLVEEPKLKEEESEALEKLLDKGKAPLQKPAAPLAPPVSQTDSLPGRTPEEDEPSGLQKTLNEMQEENPQTPGQPKTPQTPGQPNKPPAKPPTKPPQKKSVSRKSMAMSKTSDPELPEDVPTKEDEPFDEEGEQMLDDESEQDFNFW